MRAVVLVTAALGAVNAVATRRDGNGQQTLAAADSGNPRLGVAAASASTSQSWPLGVANGCIADERLTASSVLQHAGADYGPARARLGLAHEEARDIGWRPNEKDAAPFLEVDLGSEFTLASVVTQGGYKLDYGSSTRIAMWVTSYKLQTSVDGRTWDDYGGEFTGNNDADTPVKRDLFLVSMENARARFIRVLPLTCAWRLPGETAARSGDAKTSAHACALRLELYGQSPCKAIGCTSATPLGIAAPGSGTPSAGAIPASAFSASSFVGTRAPPSAARLMGKAAVFREGGWSPVCRCDAKTGKVDCGGAGSQPAFIQVDMGGEQQVNAVSTQGGSSRAAWVSEYTLSFSNDGHHWASVSGTFKGNADSVQEVRNSLARPVLARYARITPTSCRAAAAGGSYSLRFELYGPRGYLPGESSCRLQLAQPCGCGGGATAGRSMPVIPEHAPGSARSGCGCAEGGSSTDGIIMTSFVQPGGGGGSGGSGAGAAVSGLRGTGAAAAASGGGSGSAAAAPPAAGAQGSRGGEGTSGAMVVPVIVPAGAVRPSK